MNVLSYANSILLYNQADFWLANDLEFLNICVIQKMKGGQRFFVLFVAQKVQGSLCGISNKEFYLRDVTCLVHAYEEPLLSFGALICKNEIILFQWDGAIKVLDHYYWLICKSLPFLSIAVLCSYILCFLAMHIRLLL